MPFIRLLVKELSRSKYNIGDMVNAAREVFATAGIEVEEGPREDLDQNGLLDCLDLQVDGCNLLPTPEQAKLCGHRNFAGPKDVVVYFVRRTGEYWACSVHPSAEPSVAMSEDVYCRWTLAHEIGHVLGLDHVDNPNGLMYPATHEIMNPPPDLSPGEIATIQASPFVQT